MFCYTFILTHIQLYTLQTIYYIYFVIKGMDLQLASFDKQRAFEGKHLLIKLFYGFISWEGSSEKHLPNYLFYVDCQFILIYQHT